MATDTQTQSPMPPPWVVGTARPEALAGLLALPVRNRVPDLIEARLDLATSTDGVSPPDLAPFLDLCQQLESTQSPVLVTLRMVVDGGKWTTDDDRLPWFRSAAGLVSWLDIEVQSGIAREVVAAAHAAGGRVIVSHHDFSGTPSGEQLDQVIRRAWDLGADLVKVATMVNTLPDHLRLVDLVHRMREAGRAVAVVGMGALGTPLRSYLPCIGSRLTYGFLDDAVAPGQVHARDLVARLTQDSPTYAEFRRTRG